MDTAPVLPPITTKDLSNALLLFKRLKDISGDEVEIIAQLTWKFRTVRDGMIEIQNATQPTEPVPVPAPDVPTPSESAPVVPKPANEPKSQAKTSNNAKPAPEKGV